MKKKLLSILAIVLSLVTTNIKIVEGVDCEQAHGVLTFFDDSNSRKEGYVGYHHNNDPPFEEGNPLVQQLDPDVLIDTTKFTVASYTPTNFAGSLSTSQADVDKTIDSDVSLTLSTLDTSSFLTSKEVVWPESVASGVEKHTIVVQRWVVNPNWWDVFWEDTRDYVLENYEYRLAGSSDSIFDATSTGVIKDVNGKELTVIVETRVQENGVSKKKCRRVAPHYNNSRGYGVHIYPVFIIKADTLDEDSEISNLHNPKLLSGYTGEVVLYRKPR